MVLVFQALVLELALALVLVSVWHSGQVLALVAALAVGSRIEKKRIAINTTISILLFISPHIFTIGKSFVLTNIDNYL